MTTENAIAEKKQKKKITFESVCTKLIFVLSAALFFAMSFWAVKYVHTYSYDFTSEHVVGAYDTLLPNLLTLGGVLVVLYVVQALLLRGTPDKQNKKVRIFWIIDMVLIGILGFIWVTGCHVMPRDDQYQVYLSALDFSQGNFAEMEAYFYMCPQQYGLAFLYECVLWIWDSHHFIQYINIIFLVMIMYFGYQISDCLFERPRVNLYTVLVMNAFLPLFFYVNFVYGEMGAVAACMCGIWAVFKWMKTQKKRYAFIAVAAMILALMVRLNMVIISIALIIALLFFALYKKNWKALILAASLVIIPMACIKMVEFSYEARSGYEVGEGIPVILNVAMGMQESWYGAGGYNAYNHSVFWEMDGDPYFAGEVAKEYIAGRINEFKADPGMARNFYQRKIWEQWNVGCFGSLVMTNYFDEEPFAPAQAVYMGDATVPLMRWMENYVFVIYFGALIYSVYGIIREKDIRKTVFSMIVIGGLIFSLLWEAKARYVFPYIVMLLPVVAMGLHMCHLSVEKSIQIVTKKIRKEKRME